MKECPKCGTFHYNEVQCYCSACGYDAAEEHYYNPERRQSMAEAWDNEEDV